MIYIGSPYSDPDPRIRDARAYHAGAFAVACVKQGYEVYYPIASWHHLAKEHELPTDFQFWRQLNIGILRHCEEMFVLRLEGWEKSVGLAGEMQTAYDLFIPLRRFHGDTFREML